MWLSYLNFTRAAAKQRTDIIIITPKNCRGRRGTVTDTGIFSLAGGISKTRLGTTLALELTTFLVLSGKAHQRFSLEAALILPLSVEIITT